MTEVTEILKLIEQEEQRQGSEMELIPSENYVSRAVRQALGSVLTNKYSEGYPGNRYYGGQRFVDQIEIKAVELAQKLFGLNYVNVQPYSGTPANLAAYSALLNPGDTILSMGLDMGGHLSHGYKVTLSGKLYQIINYGVIIDPDSDQFGRINYEQIAELAKEHHPKLIVAGGSAYPFIIDFVRFSQIAKSVGAYLMADIAHIAGLIVGGSHPSPAPFADIITTTTHKTLRGPRGAMIMTNNQELAKKIDRAVFPGIQGGPHDNNVAALAVCLAEASQPDYPGYIKAILTNNQALARPFIKAGLSYGSENHLFLLNVSKLGLGGLQAQELLDRVGITVNKQVLPGDSRRPADPSGLRLGSPAMTTRGLSETDFSQIASWILEILSDPDNSVKAKDIKQKVKDLCRLYPLPG